MTQRNPYEPQPPQDAQRSVKFALTVVDRDGGRREYSVRVGAPVMLALAGLVLFRALIPAATESLVRRMAPQEPAVAAASLLTPLPLVRSAVTALEAPGTRYGESPDVITPLNVRDPSALVMAPAR